MPDTTSTATPRSLTSRESGTSPDWQKHDYAHWREVCRQHSFVEDHVKVAELGGSPDTPFEVAFANLAHSYLRDRAANLMEYEVGFSLIEKNSENTKAVGVFGFKVGDQWLYAPVFFLNGDLKGHELLYIKNQDMFVPLKDTWLSYLLGRKPALLGQQVGRNLSNIGVLSPNLQQLSRSPYKFASAAPHMPRLPRWAADFIPVLARLATKEAGALPEFLPALEAHGQAGIDFMCKMAETFPTIYRAFTRFHGPDALKPLAQQIKAASTTKTSVMHRWAAGDAPPEDVRFSPGTTANGGVPSYGPEAWHSVDGYVPSKAKMPTSDYSAHVKRGSIFAQLKRAAFGEKKVDLAGDPKPKVEVILRHDASGGGRGDFMLSADEKAKLVNDGRVVRDNRDESAVSKVYHKTTSLNLFSPDETNVYDLLVRPNKFERCLIVMSPYGKYGREDFCTVVSIDSGDRWLNVHPTNLFCRSRMTREAWNEWLEGLPDADSLPVSGERYGGSGEYCIILGRDGQGTTPVRAYESYESEGEDGGGKIYSVDFDDYCGYQNSKPSFSSRPHPVFRDDFDRRRIENLRFTGRAGVQFRATVDELQVPLGFKKLPLAKASDDKPGQSNKRPLQPGDLSELMWALQNSMPTLSLMADKDEYYVNDRRMYKDAAFKHLVYDWNLRADTADYLLAEAYQSPSRRHEFLVKKANPFLTNSAPGSPGLQEPPSSGDAFFNSNARFVPTFEHEQTVPGMEAQPTNRDLYKPMGPDPDTMQMAQQAAQTGQREIFDTAMLGSLLKSVRSSSMVDRYLGDLMKGMDRLGRIYFQFLWHGEEFEKRYGKPDLPEIEDGIVNTFEALGDIIMRLQQKTVEPFAEESMNEVDLGAIANQ